MTFIRHLQSSYKESRLVLDDVKVRVCLVFYTISIIRHSRQLCYISKGGNDFGGAEAGSCLVFGARAYKLDHNNYLNLKIESITAVHSTFGYKLHG